jgi:hypothetical protein
MLKLRSSRLKSKLAADYREKSAVAQIACIYCRHLEDAASPHTSATPDAGRSCELVEGVVGIWARCRHWQGSPWAVSVGRTH